MAPGRLRTTLDRFNAGARAGRDDEHGRGSKAISRYYGDRRVRPNPNLGPVERPPFYAVRLYPGDVGTAGGVRTDRHGRALDAKARPIGGPYSAGNKDRERAVEGESWEVRVELGGGGSIK